MCLAGPVAFRPNVVLTTFQVLEIYYVNFNVFYSVVVALRLLNNLHASVQ